MKRYECRTVVLPFRVGLFRRGLPDIERALNREGHDGWRLRQVMLPTSAPGTSDSVVAIPEREFDRPTGCRPRGHRGQASARSTTP